MRDLSGGLHCPHTLDVCTDQIAAVYQDQGMGGGGQLKLSPNKASSVSWFCSAAFCVKGVSVGSPVFQFRRTGHFGTPQLGS